MQSDRSEDKGNRTMHIGFGSDLVEDVNVSDEGGVQLVLNDEGFEHLKQSVEMREIHS